MPLIVDALDGLSVNPNGVSAARLAARVHRRIFYFENPGLERMNLFFFHCHLLAQLGALVQGSIKECGQSQIVCCPQGGRSDCFGCVACFDSFSVTLILGIVGLLIRFLFGYNQITDGSIKDL